MIPFNAHGQKDISGATTTYGPMNEGFLEDSIVRFLGNKTPKIIRFRWRTRNNGIINEYLNFKNNSSYSSRFNRSFTETAPSFYTESTTDILNNDNDVKRRAHRLFNSIGWYSGVKDAANQEGDFKYLIAGESASSKDKCIFVRQGFNTATTTASGTRYKSIGTFSYCAPNTSEEELLEYYSSIEVKEE